MSRCRVSLLAAVLIFAGCGLAFAQAPKLVNCPSDRVYRDDRNAGAGQVYCEHDLPGGLTVKDGPFRFWFNRDFEGSTGSYGEGREVGTWKECDRFGRCQQKDYEAIWPEEKQRTGFKPEIPVTYIDGKYVFDFASCRSTWVTHRDGQKADLDLNIGVQPDGCSIAHIPTDATGQQGNVDYSCTIPFSVGKRALGSLDLLAEFPKAGLPQYCAKQVFKTGPYMSAVHPNRGEGTAQVFTAEFSRGNNGVGVAQARLHFQDRAESRSDRCVVRYDPTTKSLFLLSDEPGKYLGPIPAGGSSSLWNSRCFLAGCSTAEVTDDTLKVHFALRFNPDRFAGEHNMFLEMVDTDKRASPAPLYGQWTVPAAAAGAAKWPSDRSCPVPMLTRPLGYWTSAPVDCGDVSGKWADPGNGGTWTLKQVGDTITGSLTVSNGKCGSVTWDVSGRLAEGVATLTAARPSPAVDQCGVAAAPSTTESRAPYCDASGERR